MIIAISYTLKRRSLLLMLCALFSLYSCRNKKEINKTDTVVTPKKSGSSAIQVKYGTQLNVAPKEIENEKLYSFIDEWYATPYKYAGTDKTGIDCSGFTSKLYETVYLKKISRASRDIYATSVEVKKEDLKEGDFVFFKIESKNVSHVGVYLMNNKFVHASTKKGVIISDLNEPYYQKYFFTGGRPK